MIWTQEKWPSENQTTVNTARAEAKMARPARSACHNLYQIYQVLSLQIPQWSSNDALIVWWNYMIYRQKIGICLSSQSPSRRLSIRQLDQEDNMAMSGLCFFLLISI